MSVESSELRYVGIKNRGVIRGEVSRGTSEWDKEQNLVEMISELRKELDEKLTVLEGRIVEKLSHLIVQELMMYRMETKVLQRIEGELRSIEEKIPKELRDRYREVKFFSEYEEVLSKVEDVKNWVIKRIESIEISLRNLEERVMRLEELIERLEHGMREVRLGEVRRSEVWLEEAGEEVTFEGELPSYLKDNPWIEILMQKGRQ